MSIIIWCYLENNCSSNQTENVKLDLDDKIPKNDKIVKSAFEYEISKLQTTGEEKITADKVSIDRSELEGMSSFFEKILANPLSVRKDFTQISNDIQKPIEEVKDVTIAMEDAKEDDIIMVSKEGQNNGTRNDTIQVDNQLAHENIVSIQKNLLETPVIPSVEKHLNNVKVTPSVPSPSRYGAIAALDMGDEQTEKERWADRTETITRLEHET